MSDLLLQNAKQLHGSKSLKRHIHIWSQFFADFFFKRGMAYR